MPSKKDVLKTLAYKRQLQKIAAMPLRIAVELLQRDLISSHKLSPWDALCVAARIDRVMNSTHVYI
jgi:hypothetical protein